MKTIGMKAKKASYSLVKASSTKRNGALKILIKNLIDQKESILEANRRDVTLAKANGLSAPLLERLSLENRFEGIIHGIQQVADLSDPIGEAYDEQTLPNRLSLAKYRIPLGVLGVIYESRPNVTLDISALSIKSGNCAILRGGSESLHTNQALVKLIRESLIGADLPSDAIQLVGTVDRAKVHEMLKLHDYIDLIIPRGNSELQQFCRANSTIPVITGGVGICHLFVDESADIERSLLVVLNAKTQRPTVCNSLDTLLVHSAIAPHFIPRLIKLLGSKGVFFRLDPRSWELVQDPSCTLASPEDWATEWLSLVLGIKIVDDLQEAINHIHLYSSSHSDGILTEKIQNGKIFVEEIHSAAVYVNASTRFTDGGEFGLGAEVAISTQKLHARGPIGLKELTTYKWVVKGDYHVRN